MPKETMDARRWLNRAWMLDMEIRALTDLKAEERERVTSITSAISDVRVSGTREVHKYDRLVMLENTIDEHIDRQLAIKQEILEFVQRIQDRRFRTLLIDRYIRFMTWEHIAVDMNYGYRQTLRLHRAALYVVSKELEKMSLNVT